MSLRWNPGRSLSLLLAAAAPLAAQLNLGTITGRVIDQRIITLSLKVAF